MCAPPRRRTRSACESSLPEVLGDAAVLVDPLDTDALAAAITDLTTLAASDAAHVAIVARGRDRAARYQWSATAGQLVALYRSLQ